MTKRIVTATSKFNYEIVDRNGWARVVRNGGPAGQLTIFRAGTQQKAKAFLQIYLMLSLQDRRKLRAAVS